MKINRLISILVVLSLVLSVFSFAFAGEGNRDRVQDREQKRLTECNEECENCVQEQYQMEKTERRRRNED